MNIDKLVGHLVTHTTWGTGTIISADSKYLTVSYNELGEKKYQFPKAFASFLTMDDDSLQKEILEEIQRLPRSEKKVFQPIKRTLHTDSVESAEKPGKLFVSKGSSGRRDLDLTSLRSNFQQERNAHFMTKNIAFKCTYNDGGKDVNGIGFLKVCSDSLIQRHIHDRRRWCSTSGCPCKQYSDGLLSRQELDTLRDNKSLICYESCMLEEWKAQAGTIRNGMREGERIKIKNAFKNSVAILTTRLPGASEKERFIFGLFLIDDLYEGDENTSGYVSAQSDYRLFFTIEEAKKLQYWKYHSNKSNPSKPSWGTGLFRYISEIEGAQILRDAVDIKQGTQSEMLAIDFFNYYCSLYRLTHDEIGIPEGALTRKS